MPPIPKLVVDPAFRRLVPFPVARVPVASLARSWKQLQQRPGVVPVLVGDREHARYFLEETRRNPESPESIVRAARHLDVDKWLAARMRQHPE